MAYPETCLGEIKYGREIGISGGAHTKYIWHSCAGCGKQRWVKMLNGEPTKNKCLSCAKKGKAPFPIPELSPNWHGGNDKITTNGYILIRRPEHHRAYKDGYVMEHIYIWEMVHNRQLLDGWVIHHLNGIKNDNRPENLVAMKKSDHLHQGEPFKKRIRELEAKVKLLEKTLDANQLIFRLEEN